MTSRPAPGQGRTRDARARRSKPPVEERVRRQLQRIRENVTGVHGSLTATSNGLLIAHDLAVYAAGPSAIVAVIGTPRLNVGMLQYQVRDVIDRITACMTARVTSSASLSLGSMPTSGRYGASCGDSFSKSSVFTCSAVARVSRSVFTN